MHAERAIVVLWVTFICLPAVNGLSTPRTSKARVKLYRHRLKIRGGSQG